MIAFIKKREAIYLALLTVIVVLSRLILFINIKNLYYVDCYDYLYKSILFVEGNKNFFSRGWPFIMILGIFINLTRSFIHPISVAKLFMFFLIYMISFCLYFLSRYFLNSELAFFSTVFSIFGINFVFYSLVPYLEIFAYLTGFLSLYIMIKSFPKLNFNIITASLLLSLLSVFTRFEMLGVFFVPLIIILFVNVVIIKKDKKYIIYLLICLSLLFFIIYPNLRTYYFQVTRFNPIKRLYFSFQWDLINHVINSIFNICNSWILNIFFKMICLLSLIYIILNEKFICFIFRKNQYKVNENFSDKLKYYFNDKGKITAFSLAISFVMLFLITCAFGSYSYKIINNELMITKTEIIARFLIGPQLYLGWLFIFALSKIIKKTLIFIRASRIKLKIFNKYLLIIKMNRFITILCLTILIIPYSYNMWNQGLNFTKEGNRTMELYKKTGDWLATNLKENEKAIAPVINVFFVNDPILRNRLIPYHLFWEKAGIVLSANNTEQEFLDIRDQLIKFLKENNSIEYVVVDWMDSYCQPIFNLKVNDELNFLLQEVNKEELHNPGQWSPHIIIYQVKD